MFTGYWYPRGWKNSEDTWRLEFLIHYSSFFRGTPEQADRSKHWKQVIYWEKGEDCWEITAAIEITELLQDHWKWQDGNLLHVVYKIYQREISSFDWSLEMIWLNLFVNCHYLVFSHCILLSFFSKYGLKDN